MTFRDKMIKLGACEEGLDWLGDRTFEQYWNDCERADWMMWELAHRIDKRQLVGLAGKLADTVSHLYTKDNVVKDCIQATQDYAAGKISDDDLRIHSDTANRARADYVADDAAYYAGAAFAAAAASCAAAGFAAFAADYSTDAAYAAYAKRNQHKIMCDIIRANVILEESIGY